MYLNRKLSDFSLIPFIQPFHLFFKSMCTRRNQIVSNRKISVYTSLVTGKTGTDIVLFSPQNLIGVIRICDRRPPDHNAIHLPVRDSLFRQFRYITLNAS